MEESAGVNIQTQKLTIFIQVLIPVRAIHAKYLCIVKHGNGRGTSLVARRIP